MRSLGSARGPGGRDGPVVQLHHHLRVDHLRRGSPKPAPGDGSSPEKLDRGLHFLEVAPLTAIWGAGWRARLQVAPPAGASVGSRALPRELQQQALRRSRAPRPGCTASRSRSSASRTSSSVTTCPRPPQAPGAGSTASGSSSAITAAAAPSSMSSPEGARTSSVAGGEEVQGRPRLGRSLAPLVQGPDRVGGSSTVRPRPEPLERSRHCSRTASAPPSLAPAGRVQPRLVLAVTAPAGEATRARERLTVVSLTRSNISSMDSTPLSASAPVRSPSSTGRRWLRARRPQEGASRWARADDRSRTGPRAAGAAGSASPGSSAAPGSIAARDGLELGRPASMSGRGERLRG